MYGFSLCDITSLLIFVSQISVFVRAQREESETDRSVRDLLKLDAHKCGITITPLIFEGFDTIFCSLHFVIVLESVRPAEQGKKYLILERKQNTTPRWEVEQDIEQSRCITLIKTFDSWLEHALLSVCRAHVSRSSSHNFRATMQPASLKYIFVCDLSSWLPLIPRRRLLFSLTRSSFPHLSSWFLRFLSMCIDRTRPVFCIFNRKEELIRIECGSQTIAALCSSFTIFVLCFTYSFHLRRTQEYNIMEFGSSHKEREHLHIRPDIGCSSAKIVMSKSQLSKMDIWYQLFTGIARSLFCTVLSGHFSLMNASSIHTKL